MSCFPVKFIEKVNIYVLDECGRLNTVTDSALLGFNSNLTSITMADNVDAAEKETKKNISGEVCILDPGCPTDNGVDFTLVTCKTSDEIQVAFGYAEVASTDVDGNITGTNRVPLKCGASVAIEVIFRATEDVCAGGASTQRKARLYPRLSSWSVSAQEAIDGTVTVSEEWTGSTVRSSTLFTKPDGSPYTTLPAELAGWQPFIADINSGAAFSYDRTITPPTGITPSCAFQPLTGAV